MNSKNLGFTTLLLLVASACDASAQTSRRIFTYRPQKGDVGFVHQELSLPPSRLQSVAPRIEALPQSRPSVHASERYALLPANYYRGYQSPNIRTTHKAYGFVSEESKRVNHVYRIYPESPTRISGGKVEYLAKYVYSHYGYTRDTQPVIYFGRTEGLAMLGQWAPKDSFEKHFVDTDKVETFVWAPRYSAAVRK